MFTPEGYLMHIVSCIPSWPGVTPSTLTLAHPVLWGRRSSWRWRWSTCLGLPPPSTPTWYTFPLPRPQHLRVNPSQVRAAHTDLYSVHMHVTLQIRSEFAHMYIRMYVCMYKSLSRMLSTRKVESKVRIIVAENIQGYQCACHNLHHLMGWYVRTYVRIYVCSSC